jgi:hypothetical protein
MTLAITPVGASFACFKLLVLSDGQSYHIGNSSETKASWIEASWIEAYLKPYLKKFPFLAIKLTTGLESWGIVQ